MRITTTFLALLGLTAAAPSTLDIRTDPTWTLKNFIRTCDDTRNICGYAFTIVTSSGSSTPCLFYDYVKPTEPGPGIRSARYSSPSNLQCAPNSPVFVNIGYDKPGNFWVVVPVDTQARKNAFFGYSASEMVDYKIVKPDHVGRELVWGQFKREAEAEAEADPEPEANEIEARNHLGTWTVKQLVRNCPTGKCDYNFKIARSIGGADITCSLSVNGDKQQSFAVVPCKENANWLISWGYNVQYGFAVMTVVNAGQNAWFGFNSVTNVTNFPDVGPNPVAAI